MPEGKLTQERKMINESTFEKFKPIRPKTYSVNSVHSAAITAAKSPAQNKTKNAALVLSGILACGAIIGGIMYSVKRGKGLKSVGNITSSGTVTNNILDIKYKKALVEGLKTKFGITTKVENLSSIVGPEEFSALIKKYEPEHFKRAAVDVIPNGSKEDYKNLSLEELEKFYKNIIDGKFRVCLHTHTNCSDGKATPQEFLDCAVRYADKIARKNPKDGLPPFMIALTDHDTVDGCQEIIKIIAENPKKYKNLKFVAGAELSVKYKDMNFDLTGLALNPFDKNLVKTLNDLKDARENTIREFIKRQNALYGTHCTLEEIVEAQRLKSVNKKGKTTLQNRAGVVYVRHALREIGKRIHNDGHYYLDNGYDLWKKDILSVDEVIQTVKNADGFTSLTHPIKSFWKYMGDDFLDELRLKGVSGIESRHQYTPSDYYKLRDYNNSYLTPGELERFINNKYEEYAKKHGMFLSGGTDSHEVQIFSREPAIDGELLEKLLN